MLQETFNNYVIATSIASVNLTEELIKDIQTGERKAKVNGKIVTLREKELAAYFLDRYSVILQEYTLADIANNDNIGNQADNRLTRNEMKLVLKGINKFSGLGLNSSEDFVLDRVSADIPATLSIQSSTVGNITTFRLYIHTDEILSEDTTFTINDSNSGGTGVGINTNLTIESGSNSGFIDLSFIPIDITTGYTTIFKINAKVGFFMYPTSGITETISGIAANQVNVEALLESRTEFNTEFNIAVSIGSVAAIDTTFVVSAVNAYGSNVTSDINVIIYAGNFYGSTTISSALAIYESYLAIFNLQTPPTGYEIGEEQSIVQVNAVALNTVNLSASIKSRTSELTSFTVSVNTDRAVSSNTTFIVNANNPFGLAGASDYNVTILAGNNSGSITIKSNSAIITEYISVFKLESVPDSIFELGIDQVTVPISAVALNIVNVAASVITRSSDLTAIRLTFTTNADVTTESTVQVLVTNPYGLGGTVIVDGVIPDDGNVVIVDISSNNASSLSYTTSFAFITPLQLGLSKGSITSSLDISNIASWELDSFKNSNSEYLDLGPGTNIPDGLFMDDSGTFLFINILMYPGYQHILRYKLNTPYDITTAIQDQDINRGTELTEGGANYDITFSSDGMYMFAALTEIHAALNVGGIYRYELSTPFDLTTKTYSGNNLPISFDDRILSIDISIDGTKLFVSKLGSYIYPYELSTPFDLTTAVLSQPVSFTSVSSRIRYFDFGKNGERLFITTLDRSLAQLNLSTAYDLTTAVLYKIIPDYFYSKVGDFNLIATEINSLGDKIYLVPKIGTASAHVKIYQLSK